MSDGELRALVSLLGDREPSVARRCRARLFQEGERAIAALRHAVAEDGAGPPGAQFAARVLRDLQDELVDRAMLHFAAQPPAPLDLEEGALLLCRTRAPDAPIDDVRQRLDALAHEVRPRLQHARNAADCARAFAHVIARVHHLTGDRRNYHDPDNSFLDQVLARGRGIPISLSVVYLLVARRVGAPLHGIGMPGHFVVRSGGEDGVFLDPFRYGRILTRAECFAHLVAAGFTRNDALLEPAADRYILARMIMNLIQIHRQRGDVAQMRRFRRLFEHVRGEPAPA